MARVIHGTFCSSNVSLVVQEPLQMASCGTVCLIDLVPVSKNGLVIWKNTSLGSGAEFFLYNQGN